jgi:hypothetical protein
MDELEESQPSTGNKRYLKSMLLLPGISLVFLIFLVTTSQPGEGGPTAVLVLLLLLFCFTAGLVANAIIFLWGSKESRSFSSMRLLYTSVSVAVGVTLLIGLQTLGQLRVIDVVLVLVFEFLLVFYLLRRF